MDIPFKGVFFLNYLWCFGLIEAPFKSTLTDLELKEALNEMFSL